MPSRDNSQPLARVDTGERRRAERRATNAREVIANHWAFTREERRVLKQLERRRTLRRDQDARARVRRI